MSSACCKALSVSIWRMTKVSALALSVKFVDVESEVGIETGAVDTAIPNRWEFYRSGDSASFIYVIDKRHEKTTGTILEVAIELRAFLCRGSHHRIDVVLMAHGQDALYFPLIHGPMLEIKPYAVEVVMGGIANVEGQVVTHGAETGTLPGANLL
jgi:hypothetical protein